LFAAVAKRAEGMIERSFAEKVVDLGGAAAGGKKAEMVEAISDVIGDAAKARFLETDEAIMRAREIRKEGADADRIGSGDDAELARAAPDGIARRAEMI
jgi:hypothetical protein